MMASLVKTFADVFAPLRVVDATRPTTKKTATKKTATKKKGGSR